MPFLRKEECCVIEGLVTTSGTRLFADYRPDHTSTLAQRYMTAGVVFFGATKVPPFCVTVDTPVSGTAGPLSGTGERADLDFIADILIGNTKLRKQRAVIE